MNHKHLLIVLILTTFLFSCNRTVRVKQEASLIDQHPCRIANQEAVCGRLPVYENPTLQGGRVIDLNVAVIKSTDPNPAPDPVFFLAGGPSEAATESTGNIEFIAWIFKGNRDIVLVDQRGTGGSHQILIPAGPDFSGLNGEELETRLAEWIEQTLAELDMDTRYYTTSVAMDDLDAVRQALGYDKINLFGTSYGATAAQYYLRQHEDHVRTAVLLAGSLLDVPMFELEAKHAQRTLNLVFDQCEVDARCRSAFPDLRGEFNALLERLDQKPVEVTLDSGTVTLTRDYFAAKVEWITRNSQQIASLPLELHQAYENNDWTTFAEAGVPDFGPIVMTYSIRCSEKWAAFDPGEVARQGLDSYLAGWSVSQAQRYAPVCKYLPHGETPEGLSLQPSSDKPVLLFNGEWDILDPPENVIGAKELWKNSLSLTVPWQSHEISDTSTAMCIGTITKEFVENESVEGLYTTCLDRLSPPHFRTIE